MDDGLGPVHADTTSLPTPPGSPSPPAIRSRRRRIGVVVAVVVLLAGGTGVYILRGSDSHPASTNSRPPGSEVSRHPNLVASTRPALDALLERRSQAVADNDRDAFLADLDSANKKLVSSQRLIFDNLTKLHASENDFAISSYYTQPAPVDPTDLDGAWQPGVAHVESRVQLDEVDPRPTVAYYKWTVEVRDGKLVITGIAPSPYPHPSAPMPWETAAFTVSRTAHMLVAATPDIAKRTKQVAAAAERAYRQSRSLWPKHATDEFVIFATTNRKLMGSWYGKLESLPDPTGVTIQVPTCCIRQEEKVGDVTSTHIVVDIKQARDRIDLEWLLAHELTHAVAEPNADIHNAGALRWADEGYAEFVGVSLLDHYGYVANWDQVARKYAGGGAFDGKLPTDSAFYTKDVDVHYALAVRFFEYLADRYGKTKTRDFYFYLNATKTADPDAAMRKYFNTPEQALVAAWANWVG